MKRARWIFIVLMFITFNINCEFQDDQSRAGNDVGEGEEGEGEGEGEGQPECDPGADHTYSCTCPDGREGYQVCQEDSTLGPCNCEGNEGEGEECPDNCPECEPYTSRCTEDGMRQVCDNAGYWCVPDACPEGQTCENGNCVNQQIEAECAFWTELTADGQGTMLCGKTAWLWGFQFGRTTLSPTCDLMPPSPTAGIYSERRENGAVCAVIPRLLENCLPHPVGPSLAYPKSVTLGWVPYDSQSCETWGNVWIHDRDPAAAPDDPNAGPYLDISNFE